MVSRKSFAEMENCENNQLTSTQLKKSRLSLSKPLSIETKTKIHELLDKTLLEVNADLTNSKDKTMLTEVVGELKSYCEGIKISNTRQINKNKHKKIKLDKSVSNKNIEELKKTYTSLTRHNDILKQELNTVEDQLDSTITNGIKLHRLLQPKMTYLNIPSLSIKSKIL